MSAPQRRRWKTTWRRLVLTVLGLGLLVYLTLLAWVVSGMRGHDLPLADAVLVLGARAYPNGRPNPCLLARVRRGVEAAQANSNRLLIVSGGTDREDGQSEARVMREMALGLGFPASRVLLEPAATSTRENLRFAHTLMNERQLHSVLIVSEPFHLARASWLARREGLTFGTLPAPGSPCALRGTLREPVALLGNTLMGP